MPTRVHAHQFTNLVEDHLKNVLFAREFDMECIILQGQEYPPEIKGHTGAWMVDKKPCDGVDDDLTI